MQQRSNLIAENLFLADELKEMKQEVKKLKQENRHPSLSPHTHDILSRTENIMNKIAQTHAPPIRHAPPIHAPARVPALPDLPSAKLSPLESDAALMKALKASEESFKQEQKKRQEEEKKEKNNESSNED